MMRDRWQREWADLAEQRPSLHSRLTAIATHPVVPLSVAASVVGAACGQVSRGDATWFATAGDSLLTRHGLDVFSDSGLQIGPLYVLFLALSRAASRLVHLPPYAAVGAIESAIVMLLAISTCRRLHGQASTSSRAGEWAIGMSLLLVGILAEVMLSGHPEEVVAGLLLLRAGLKAREDRPWEAGLLIAAASSLKLWGVLGVALLLFLPRPLSVVRGALVAGGALALLYSPFVVFGEFRTFDFSWPVDGDSVLGLLTGYTGSFTTSMRAIQVGLVIASVGCLIRRSATVQDATMALITVRLILDPGRQSYYFAPLLLVALLVVTEPDLWWRSRAALVTVACAPPGVVAVNELCGPTQLGWTHAVVLLAMLGATLARGLSRPPTAGRRWSKTAPRNSEQGGIASALEG